MKEKLNIGLISKSLNIPCSTLRYWENENLIRLERNKDNDYREYSISTIFDILDIAFYRSLNIPIKELKTLSNKSILEMEELLINNKNDLKEKIKELQETIKKIEYRLKQIETYEYLKNDPYDIVNEIKDINKVASFDLNNINILKEYILAPEKFILYVNREKNIYKYGIVKENINHEEVLWQKEKKNKKYIRFLIREHSFNLTNNIDYHIEKIKNKGYETGEIIAKYLLTTYDNEQYDYYDSFIEIK